MPERAACSQPTGATLPWLGSTLLPLTLCLLLRGPLLALGSKEERLAVVHAPLHPVPSSSMQRAHASLRAGHGAYTHLIHPP